MRFGTLMLRCGTVSFRVEEAMRQVALNFGVERLDAFTTLTGITASAHCGALHHTQVARIYSIGVNMSCLSKVEFLSQHIPSDATPSSLMVILDQIESQPPLYSPVLTVVAVAIACGAFSGLNGGGMAEFVAATAASGVGQWVRMHINRRYLNPIAITVVCAAIATLLCNFALIRSSLARARASGKRLRISSGCAVSSSRYAAGDCCPRPSAARSGFGYVAGHVCAVATCRRGVWYDAEYVASRLEPYLTG